MGQQLLYLRAKTSSNFVLGTSQLAIEVSEYTNVSFDKMCIDEISYDGEDQPIPSPDGMPAFEDLIVLEAGAFHEALLGHENFVSADTPDMTGRRVEVYQEAIKNCDMIIRFWHTFVTKDVDIISFSDPSKIQAMLFCIKAEQVCREGVSTI